MRKGTLSLKGRALRYLSQREHSRLELQRKLMRHLQREWRAAATSAEHGVRADAAQAQAQAESAAEASADEFASEAARELANDAPQDAAEQQSLAREQLDTLLDELSNEGWLSDTRAAESLVRIQSARSGHLRLKQQLQAKGLGAELVAQSLSQLRESEPHRAMVLWQKRFGCAPADAKDYARQARFLASRGFDGDIIRKILDQRTV